MNTQKDCGAFCLILDPFKLRIESNCNYFQFDNGTMNHKDEAICLGSFLTQ